MSFALLVCLELGESRFVYCIIATTMRVWKLCFPIAKRTLPIVIIIKVGVQLKIRKGRHISSCVPTQTTHDQNSEVTISNGCFTAMWMYSCQWNKKTISIDNEFRFHYPYPKLWCLDALSYLIDHIHLVVGLFLRLFPLESFEPIVDTLAVRGLLITRITDHQSHSVRRALCSNNPFPWRKENTQSNAK